MYQGNNLVDSLSCYIGKTVTIYTTSGGLSGSGFTGVLACVNECQVKLITSIGAAPACPIGSPCGGGCNTGYNNGYDYGYGYGYGNSYGSTNNGGCGCGCGGNWLGAVTEIPICAIASFTHNAL